MRACVASGATLARENAPVAESLTTTRLATTWLPAKLRSPAGGRATPAGKTTKEPAVVVVWMAVTLRTTAVGRSTQRLRTTAPAPVAGTPADPPVPATLNERATPGPRALVLRVSRTRIGAVGCSRPSPGSRVAPPLLVQPSTSATTLTSAPPA